MKNLRNKFNAARKNLSYRLSLKSAEDKGFDYQHKPPALSAEKRKELMEASALETPRSSMRAVMSIVKPYWTKAGPQELAIASALLATSLFMTWYAVQVTVDFGNWQSGLTNTIVQMVQGISSSRADIVGDVIGNFPLIQDALTADPLLKEALLKFPDATAILYDSQFAELIQANPGLKELLGTNPTMEKLFMEFPSFKEQVAQNPEILERLKDFNSSLAEKFRELPSTKQQWLNLASLCGGDFFVKWGSAFKETFNSVASFVKAGDFINTAAQEAIKLAWTSKDLATIALKYTAMAIVSFKSSQYLALRWRAWTTGYLTSKWLGAKSYLRLRNEFNNVDNPGQRIQEDPAKFTAGAVSLMTGGMSSFMTLASFSGMLWGMGEIAGIPHGMFYTSVAYAAGLTALTLGAGYKLPGIQREQQRREADFRNAITGVHNNAEQIAQSDNPEVEKQLIKERFSPTMKNSVREIGTQTKLILVDATIGNLSIPIPYLIGALAVGAGTGTMGTIQTLNYAFNRVTSSLSFFVNRFEQLSYMKATADRISLMDQAVDASHYIEEEKKHMQKQPGPTAP